MTADNSNSGDKRRRRDADGAQTTAPTDQPVRVADLLDRSESILMSSDSNAEHQAAILELIADYYSSAGHPAKAEILLQRSLELTLGARAELYLRQGNIDAAIADGQRALQTSQALQGDKTHSSYTGFALAVLARIYGSRDQPAVAQKLATDALAHLSDTLGEDHPETARIRQFLLSSSTGASVAIPFKAPATTPSCRPASP